MFVTMKFFVLLMGRVSLMVTTSPSRAFMSSGLCALTFVLLRSYRSYLGTKWRRSNSTVTVFVILSLVTVPVNVRPRVLWLLFVMMF
jgi:hypothetical protein